MKRRFSEEQIVRILREGEVAESKADVWRKHGASEWTYYGIVNLGLDAASVRCWRHDG